MKNLIKHSLLMLCILMGALDTSAQKRLLGKINLPNSGAEEAQADFIEGMLFLHNFEYADAARAFRRAQDIDPDFALAYYGEAKSHNHPLWMQQDREAAMNVLEKLGKTVSERQAKALSQREKDYMMSLEVLYGNTPETTGLSKQERDDAYEEKMAVLHKKYPEDHEITAFYGLSILGTAHEGRDYATYMRAAAELFEVWNENPKHPGAVHYLIHSFDDPIHAPLGLPMAKVYAQIAPDAAHAQHMTSHIFLALGMWQDVVDANITARRVQTNRQKELGEETTVCGHYTWWLQYGYLQLEETVKAMNVLSACAEKVKNKVGLSGRNYGTLWHFAVMRGHQVIDSESWEIVKKITANVAPISHAATSYYFTNAYAEIQSGNISTGKQMLQKLLQAPESDQKTIQVHQLRGLLLVESGQMQEGLEELNKAASKEEALPVDFGPPEIIKPSFELLGDIFIHKGDYEKAAEFYARQLERTPKRHRSMVGLQRSRAEE